MENTKKLVYTIIDSDTLQRPLFRRIGIAFINADRSMNVLLDAYPVNGRLHIRDEAPRKNSELEAARRATPEESSR